MRVTLCLLLWCLLLGGCNSVTEPDITQASSESESLARETGTVYLTIATAADFRNAPSGQLFQKAIDRLVEESEGRFDIAFYQNGVMGDDEQLFQAVQRGTVSVVMMSPTSQAAQIPETMLLEIPRLFPDSDSYHNFLIQEGVDFLASLYEKNGLVLLGISISDYRHLTSSKPIESIEDLQGLKIRIQDNVCHQVFWESLGAKPVTVSFNELYMALYNGIVDAQENPYGVILAKCFYEVQQYVVETGHLPNLYTYVMNQEQYEAMPVAVQEELQEMFRRYVQDLNEETSMVMKERKFLKEEYGMEIVLLTEEWEAGIQTGKQAVVDYLKIQLGAEMVDQYLNLVEVYQKGVSN